LSLAVDVAADSFVDIFRRVPLIRTRRDPFKPVFDTAKM
jgi:hypothetical protein